MTRPRPFADALPTDPAAVEWAERIASHAPALLAYLDHQQRFCYVNDTHRVWLGIDPSSLIGRSLRDVIGRRNYQLAAGAIEQAYGGQPASFEGDLHDGRRRRYAHGNLLPDLAPDGKVRGIFTALLDITERRSLELKLHESEQRFFNAFQYAAIGMALTHPDGRFLRVNAAVCQMLGYSESELLALDIAAITHPEDLAADMSALQDLLAGRCDSYQQEKRNLHKSGRVVHIQLSVSLVRDEHGQPRYLVSQVQDISQRKAYEEALHNERELAQVTLRSIGDAVITTDLQLRVTSLNPIAEGMTGWSQSEARGRLIEDVFQLHDADSGEIRVNPLRQAIETNTIINLTSKTLLRHRHGFDTPVEDSSAPIHDHADHVIGGVLVFHDVSETRALALKMIHLTQHDPLTGLPNRSQLNSHIEQAMTTATRRKQRAVLMYLDIDDLQRTNELHGYHNGDRVLQAMAGKLQSCLVGEQLLSRYGGDEFVMVLPHVESLGEVVSLCQRIINGCRQIGLGDLPELDLQVSVGISVYPDDADNAENLLQHAEVALCAAKAQGDHSYRFFTASMNERAVVRRHIEAALRQALSHDQLQLHYQPKVDAHHGRIVGAEALLRWYVDGKEYYAPNQFVPVAESSGLIQSIGAWAVYQACQQAYVWMQMGHPIPVSVNVSPVQFRHAGFYAWLDNVLNETGLDPALLELELTEGMVMSGGESTTWLLQQIRERGVRLSLDDFGTGYCSLSYLAHFPIDTLKIDRTFVRDVTLHGDTATITRAIIALACGLNIQVVAEGVETHAQSDFLRDAGCAQMQGFLYGEAMPAAALAQRLASGA